jgi:hypothetical protein
MSDPGLRACSYAARGLWKDLLCIAGSNKAEYGFVSLNGKKLEAPALAKMTNGTVEEVEPLLEELSRNGVFSRDRRGVIYCRRMIRAEKSRSNGRLGGNPNLLKKGKEKNQVQPNPNPPIPEPEPGLFANAGGEPPLDVRTKLFREGLAALQRITGKGRNACASLVGKWLRNVDDDCVAVLRAIEDAESNRVADPVPWILKALAHRMRGGVNGNGQRTGNGAASLLARMMKDGNDGRTTIVDDARALPAGDARRH